MIKSAVMKNAGLLLLLIVFAMATNSDAQKTKASPLNGKGPIGEGRLAMKGPVSQHWTVSPTLDADLARFKPVHMPLTEKLTARERQMLDKLVEACNYLDAIFWRQSDPEGLRLYQQLLGSRDPRDEKLRRLLYLNGSRHDLIDDNRPFIGTQPILPGRALYPAGITRDEIEGYVKAHPEKRAEIYSPYTVVVRRGQELDGIPYHVIYRPFLVPAAKALREAALLSPDPHFANFLRLRADALLSDDYYTSDLIWLELKDPKFDIIFAPYETYLDELLGVKTSYGAAILIRNEAESQKLAVFQKYVADIQDALPLGAEDRPSKRGHQMPMEVMDSPFRSGDMHHGYQAVADNLPNDPRFLQEHGTKKIFFKNFMDARVNDVILPLARRMMRPDQAAIASGEGYMAHTLMHEISHGLGPAFARMDGKQVEINEALGPVYSGLEEAKADVVGMFALIWMFDHGYLPAKDREGYFASYLAGNFRSIRFGVAEAHGKAEMMEFNYLSEQGVFVRDAATGLYQVEYAKMPAAITALAKELLEQEATGDRRRAEAWMEKYGKLPVELEQALKKQADIPVDFAPTFSYPGPKPETAGKP